MMLTDQHHQPRYNPTTRHRLTATAYRALARAAGGLDRLSRSGAALAVGALMVVGGVSWLGAEHSPSHPAAVEARPAPWSAPELVAWRFADHLPGVVVTDEPTVLSSAGLVPDVAEVEIPAAPHPVVVVLDHVDGPWRVVDHWEVSR